MNELIVLSDIHGNLSALRAVVKDFQTNYSPDALILLGDLIDYGMRSNEVISEIKKLERQYPVVCNLWGNHEVAVMCPEEHLCRFSSVYAQLAGPFYKKYAVPHIKRSHSL